MLLWPYRLVEKYGEGQWSLISTFFTGRIGKQCRERWHHQLNPKINRNAWSVEEERIIVAAHKVCAGILGSHLMLVMFRFWLFFFLYCIVLSPQYLVDTCMLLHWAIGSCVITGCC